jgi:hypothetical protein
MKNLALVIAALTLFAGSQAHAVYVMGQLRPFAQADLQVITATGNLKNINAVRLTEATLDGVPGQNGQRFIVEKNGQSVNMKVSSSKIEGCNIRTVTATQEFPAGVISEGRVSLKLVDLSRATCVRVAPGREWSVILYESAFGAQIGKAELAGTPHGVITAQ